MKLWLSPIYERRWGWTGGGVLVPGCVSHASPITPQASQTINFQKLLMPFMKLNRNLVGELPRQFPLMDFINNNIVS